MKNKAVRAIMAAAGGPVALSREWGVSYAAINQFDRQGYFPLERAKDAVVRWPGVAELRDLVKPSIRQAMDLGEGGSLLA